MSVSSQHTVAAREAQARWLLADLPVVALLCALSGLLIGHLQSRTLGHVGILYVWNDAWFGADVARVFENLTDVRSDQSRTSVHPIFPFLLLPVARVLEAATGLGALDAVLWMVRATGAALVSTVYLTARALGLSCIDGVLVAAATASTATFMFWFAVVETFPFGSLTIALVVAMASLRTMSKAAWVGAGAAALSITTTNWLVAIFATLRIHSVPKSFTIVLISLAGVGVASIWQRTFLPSAAYFFRPAALSAERQFVEPPHAVEQPVKAGATRLASFWLYPGVAPAPVARPRNYPGAILTGIVTFPTVAAWPPGAVQIAASAVWLGLLASGLLAAWTRWRSCPVSATTLLFLGAQFALHSVYGDQPFLYSAHFLPCFAALLMLSLLRFRTMLARLAVLVYCAIASWSNYSGFSEGMRLMGSISVH